MDCTRNCSRFIGIALIAFAIFFNLPYAWLAANFHYPDILREPAGRILSTFAGGGSPLILAWAAFTLAALLFAPVAVVMNKVTRAGAGMAALGVAAGVTQAIGLSRWVYVVPGLAGSWVEANAEGRGGIEAIFMTLHQFAGVGIGEAIGQSLTAFWLIGVALSQWNDPRYAKALAGLGIAAGVILLLGLVEGLATVLDFNPGIFSLGALVGFLALTVWLIWTGIACIRRSAV